eukprot:scaffold35903_cov20-Prasinocladus_malaysianus.AAC.1
MGLPLIPQSDESNNAVMGRLAVAIHGQSLLHCSNTLCAPQPRSLAVAARRHDGSIGHRGHLRPVHFPPKQLHRSASSYTIRGPA